MFNYVPSVDSSLREQRISTTNKGDRN